MWLQLSSHFLWEDVGFSHESKNEKCRFKTVIQTKPCPFPHLSAPGSRWMFPTWKLVIPRLGQGHRPSLRNVAFWCFFAPGMGKHQAPHPAGAMLPLAARGVAFINQIAVLVKKIHSSPPWVSTFLPAGPDPPRLPCAVLYTE